jgi:predicted RNA-binding protein with PIN domain
MPFLIDGYNLLWAVHKLGDDSESITDVQMCKIVSGYLKQTGESGEIVFDGIGPPDKSGFDNMENLEVFFTGLGVDADSVIENKIRANTAPRRLTVVSSDRRVRDAARARKAVAVKSDRFFEQVGKQLRKKTRNVEPQAKQQGLSEGETEQWLKFFGLD